MVCAELERSPGGSWNGGSSWSSLSWGVFLWLLVSHPTCSGWGNCRESLALGWPKLGFDGGNTVKNAEHWSAFHLGFKFKDFGTITPRPKLCPGDLWVGRAVEMRQGLTLGLCRARDPESDPGERAGLPLRLFVSSGWGQEEAQHCQHSPGPDHPWEILWKTPEVWSSLHPPPPFWRSSQPL